MSEERNYAGAKESAAGSSQTRRIIDLSDIYLAEMSRFPLLSREQEVRYSKHIISLKQRILYNLCMLPYYAGNLEDSLKKAIEDSPEHSENLILLGKDNWDTNIKEKLRKCIDTADLINNKIKELDLHYKRTGNAKKRKELRKKIDGKKRNKFELLRKFGISKIFLHSHIVELLKQTTNNSSKFFSEEDISRIYWLKCLDEEYKKYFNEFINSNLRLVVSIVYEYTGKWKNNRRRYTGSIDEDIIQEGNKGLVSALERFDPKQGFRFCTYAVYWIKQSIKKNVPRITRTIRIPPDTLQAINKINAAAKKFCINSMSKLSLEKIAELSGLKISTAKTALEVMCMGKISLDQEVNPESKSALKEFIADPNSVNPSKRIEYIILREKIEKALRRLEPRERKILKLRVGIPDGKVHTLKECGDMFNISKERARQIERKALRKLHYRSINLHTLLDRTGNS